MSTESSNSPFHAGERAIHERLAIRERMEWVASRAIRDFMPEQHRTFYAQLPFLVVGALDATQRPWASVFVGEPGFMQTPDERTLTVRAAMRAGDPIGTALVPGAWLGVLGIELHTRRRNRASGRVSTVSAEGFAIHVEQTVGNCPKYIQGREFLWRRDPEDQQPRGCDILSALDDDARHTIQTADTCFVASHAPPSAAQVAGTDVSHRGGRAGFVRIDTDGTLVVPDFVGNNLFMTLGNLLINPHAGLLFVDFARGDLLSLTGRTEILWDGDSLGMDGAQRAWRFIPEAGVRLRDTLPLAWTFRDWSPATLTTGNWTQQTHGT